MPGHSDRPSLRQYFVSGAALPNVAFAALSSLAVTWSIASLWFPYGWDHGIIASVGDAIVRGGMPYRDAWDMKGPLAFYGYALAQWLFGRNMWGIRLLDLTLLAVAAVALARMVARIASPRIGAWTAVALVLWYGSLGWFFVSQPDGWVAMLVLLAVGSFVNESDRLTFGGMASSGCLIGCCALVKPFYGAFLLVPAVFAMSARASTSRKSGAVAVAAAAALLPALVVLTWFAYRGALDSLVEVHVSYAAAYADSMRPDLVARRIFNYFWINGVATPAGAVAVLVPVIGFGASVLWHARRQLALVLLAWMGVALFCIAIQGKFWFYHWVPAFPPFLVLAAVGLHRLTDGHRGVAGGSLIALVSAALFLVQIVAVPAVDVARWLLYVGGINTPKWYYSQYFRRNYVAADEIEAAGYIRDRTDDSETVLVWGNDATISFLSGRRGPNRFVFAMPLTREVRGAFRAAYRNEYMKTLAAGTPAYIVVGQPHDGSNDKQRDIREFAELQRFIGTHYTLERTVGFLDLYRHNP
jgi:hypothetical protein